LNVLYFKKSGNSELVMLFILLMGCELQEKKYTIINLIGVYGKELAGHFMNGPLANLVIHNLDIAFPVDSLTA